MNKKYTNKIFKNIKHIDKKGNEYTANSIHYEVGKIVREAIKEAGGTMPADLPTPNRSLKVAKRIKTFSNKIKL